MPRSTLCVGVVLVEEDEGSLLPLLAVPRWFVGEEVEVLLLLLRFFSGLPPSAMLYSGATASELAGLPNRKAARAVATRRTMATSRRMEQVVTRTRVCTVCNTPSSCAAALHCPPLAVTSGKRHGRACATQRPGGMTRHAAEALAPAMRGRGRW